MNKRYFKRLMSVLLAVLLVVNTIPSAVFASEDGYEESSAIEYDADLSAEPDEDPAELYSDEGQDYWAETPDEDSIEETPEDAGEEADTEDTDPQEADPEEAGQEEMLPEEDAWEELPETGSDIIDGEEIAPSGEELPEESYGEEQSGDDEMEEEDPEWVDEEADDEGEDSEETPDLENFTYEMEFSETIDIDPNMLPSEEELLQLYIDRLAFGSAQRQNLLKAARRTKLGDAEQKAYEILKAAIEDIASGTETSTHVTIPVEDLYTDQWYSGEDLGFDSFTSIDDVYNNDVINALFENYKLKTEQVINALLVDCPYDLYWFDKDYGVGTETPFRISAIMNEGEVLIKVVVDESTYEFYLAVSDDYALAGGETYNFTKGTKSIVTDRAKTIAASAAVEAAQAVVNANAGKSDYDRLVAYKDYICSAVSYNYRAAGGDIPYGDPWQLIWVFDGDPNTNVVCEGYAKAFKFLCDLDGGLDCNLVSGQMSGGTGAGPHMWNIVTLNGKNYLVDVTNCDEDSVGAPDKLFLKGSENGSAEGYAFTISGQSITYEYDSETKALFSTDERTLAESDFDPNADPAANAVASITRDGETTYYETLKAAINAVENDGTDTIVMLNDSNEGTTVINGTKNVTLDLAGHTVTGTSTRVITVKNSGSLTVTDSVEGGEIVNTNSYDDTYAIYVESGGTFTLEGGTIDGYWTISTYGTVNIKGGEVKSRDYSFAILALTNGEINVSGGSIAGDEYGIWARGTDVTVNVSGGTIKNTSYNSQLRPKSSAIALTGNNASLTITGGEIEGNNIGVLMYNGKATISEGVIKGAGNSIVLGPGSSDYKGTFTINGGHYSDAVGNGSKFTRLNGMTLVQGADPAYPALYSLKAVAKNATTGEFYGSLAAAVEAAADGNTIVPLEDITLTETLTIPNGRNITLDLAGKTISYPDGTPITNNGTLTITDSAGGGKVSGKNALSVGGNASLNIQNGKFLATEEDVIVTDETSTVKVSFGNFSNFIPEKYWDDHCACVKVGDEYRVDYVQFIGNVGGNSIEAYFNDGMIFITKIVGYNGVDIRPRALGYKPNVDGESLIFALLIDRKIEIIGDTDRDNIPVSVKLDKTSETDKKVVYDANVVVGGEKLVGGEDYVVPNSMIIGTFNLTLDVSSLSLDAGAVTYVTHESAGYETENFTANVNASGEIKVSVKHFSTLTVTGAVCYIEKDGEKTYYDSIIRANSEAVAGDTITLVKDIDLAVATGDGFVSVHKNITLDLNGHTLTGNNGEGTVKVGGDSTPTLTVKDSADGGAIQNSNNNDKSCAIYLDNATLNMEGGIIDSKGIGIEVDSGDVTINDGVIKGTEKSISLRDDYSGIFKINGGYFSDTEGNGDKFTRPEGKILILCTDDKHAGLYGLNEVVAKIDDTPYASLQDAVNAVRAGETIELLVDTAENVDIASGRPAFTIDLGKHTLSYPEESDKLYTLRSASSEPVVVKNGTIKSTIKSEEEGWVINAKEGAKLTFENIKIEGAATGIRMEEGDQIVIGSGTSVETAGTAIDIANTNANASVTIKEGASITSTNSAAIVAEPFGTGSSTRSTINIEGGTITSADKETIHICDKAKLNITGGTIKNTADAGKVIRAIDSAEVTISDGKFISNGATLVKESSGAFAIKGGVFSDDIGNGEAFTRPTGKMLVRNVQDPNKDMYRLADALCYIEKEDVKTYYESPSAAHGDAADSGDTITLINNVDYTQLLDGYLWVRKDITLDLNGFTLTGDAYDGTVLVGNGAALTVKDSAGGGTINNSYNVRTIWVEEGTLNIESGTIASASGIPVYAEDTVNISGGTISSGSNKNAVEVRGGSLTVTGGTINAGGKGIYADSGNVTITDGIIKGNEGSVLVSSGYSGTFAINGGYYSDNAGNGDAFTRPDNMRLAPCADREHAGLYELGHYIAKIDSAYYTTLQAAVEAVSDGETIELLEDTAERINIERSRPAFTLDLGGHTLSWSESGVGVLTVNNSEPILVKNGTIARTSETPSRAVYLGASAKVTFEDVSIESTGSGVGYAAGSGATIVFGEGTTVQTAGTAISVGNTSVNATVTIKEGARITSTNGSAIVARPSTDAGTTRATINIEGGTITSAGDATIDVQSEAKLNITGGTITSAGDATIDVQSEAKLNITGGTITNTAASGSVIKTADSATATISGGKFTSKGDTLVNKSSGAFTINGGAYSDDTGNSNGFTRPEGEKLILGGDGYYHLQGDYVCCILKEGEETAYFPSLDAAMNALASDGTKTIRILKDINLGDSTCNVTKQFTLDLNGHTVTGTSTQVIKVNNRGSLTVTDSARDGTILNNNPNIGETLYTIYVESSGIFTLEGGTIDGYCTWTIGTYGTVNINGGEVKSPDYHFAILALTNGEINVSGGSIAGDEYGIWARGDYVAVNVRGGTIKNTSYNSDLSPKSSAIALTGNETILNITGGEIDGNNIGVLMYNGNATISDGIIKGSEGSVSVGSGYSGTFAINGGYYSDNAGNGDKFTRPEGALLVPCTDSAHAELYELKRYVAEVNGTYYESLQSAIDAAEAGQTVKLLVDDEEQITINKSITLDLNEKALTYPGASSITNINHITISGEGTNVTLTGDGTINSSSADDSFAVYSIKLEDSSSLTIDGVSLSSKLAGIDAEGSASLTLSKGSINSASVSVQMHGNANFTMTGGSIKSTGEKGVTASDSGKITIKDGNIEADKNAVAIAETATAQIDGGTIKSTKKASVENQNGSGTFTINGGKYSDDAGNKDVFTKPAGQKLLRNGEGLYELGTVVAKNVTTGAEYGSLDAAIRDAGNTPSNIQLLANTTEQVEVGQNQNITLDLNGKTLTGTGSPYKYGIVNYGNLTIEDSSGNNSGTIQADWAALFIYAGTVNVKGGTIYGRVGGLEVWTYNTRGITSDININISGGEVRGSNNGIIINGPSDGNRTVNINITGGTLTMPGGYNGQQNDAVIRASVGTAHVNMTGGTILSRKNRGIPVTPAISIYRGNVKISGGTVKYEDNDITKVILTFVPEKSVEISGGWFTTQVADDYAAEGYEPTDERDDAPDAGAKYTVAKVPEITYHLPDGATNDPANPAYVYAKDLPIILKPATMENRDFQGWYTDEAYTNAITEITAVPARNIDVYGKFGPDKSELKKAIAEATQDKADTPVSEDGKELKPGTEYVNQAAADALQAAIAAAQAVADKPDATQSEVDAATEAMKAAKKTFDEAKKTATVDKNKLNAAITAATEDKAGTPVSEDGKDQKPGTEYVNQAAADALQAAINAAQEVLNDPDATQSEVDEAKDAMNTAKQTFDEAKQTASTSKNDLNAAIDAAKKDKDDTPVSADGKDVPDSTKYVDQATQNALNAAIAAAQAVADKTDATQVEVDAAKAALDQAKQAFDDAKQEAKVDKNALNAAIAAATEDKTDTPVSADGEDLPDGTKYVDKATQDALTEAIAAAQAVADKTDATQNQVDAATEAMKAAKKTFDDAKKTAGVDKDALEQAIADATADKNNTPVSADGKDLPDGTKYVDQATQDALTKAIADAQDVANDPDATQDQVDAAKDAIDAAKAAFDKAKKTASVDKDALNAAITAAAQDKADTPVSADGKDQKPGTEYVDQATQNALTEAIAAAQAVADKTDATQDQVDAAKAAIEAAKAAFDKAKKTAGVDKDALEQAIADATADKNNTPVSADGKDQKPGTEYVDQATQDALTKAIADAQDVANDPDATQNQVNTAKEALDQAKQAFDNAKKEAKVDKATLQNAVDKAINPKDIQESSDGSDVPEGTSWATPADKAAYEKALTDANTVLADQNATQNNVDDALKALNEAAAKIKTKGKDVDRKALADAINAAIEDKSATQVSTDGKDLAPGTEYVNQAAADVLQTAIEAAQAVLSDSDATQSEVDEAKDAINTAKQTFDVAKKKASTSKNDLNTSIDAAKKDKVDTPVSADGKDQKPGTEYVDQAAADALQKAIDAAQAVADKTDATQNQVDAAKTALDAAKKTFDEAKKKVPDTTPDTEPDTNPDTEPDTTPDTTPDTEPDTNPDTNPDTEPNTDPNTNPDTKLFTITYDLDGGTLDGQTGTIRATYEEGTVITLPTPSREGYTFDYWEGSRYEAGDKYTVTEDHKFTARWQKQSASGTGDSTNGTTASAAGAAGSVTSKGDLNTTQSVKTGDNTPIALWLVLLAASVCVIAGAGAFRKRYRTDK